MEVAMAINFVGWSLKRIVRNMEPTSCHSFGVESETYSTQYGTYFTPIFWGGA
jgi:hypothetical protein